MNNEWMDQMRSKKENSGLLLLVTLLTSGYHLASIMSVKTHRWGGAISGEGRVE